jgi:hypothetical protein
MEDSPERSSRRQIHLIRACARPAAYTETWTFPGWLVSGGESGGGARPLDPE